MTEEGKKEKTEHINLKVLGQDGQMVHFKIKQHTSLKKLMSAYCARSKLAQSTVRFRFDGQAISENDTPRALDMEDGDTIEVFQQQTGGGLDNTTAGDVATCTTQYCSDDYNDHPNTQLVRGSQTTYVAISNVRTCIGGSSHIHMMLATTTNTDIVHCVCPTVTSSGVCIDTCVNTNYRFPPDYWRL